MIPLQSIPQLILLEFWFFIILMALSALGIIASLAVALFWWRAPRPIKNFVVAWLKRMGTDVSVTDNGGINILPKRIGAEGQLTGKVSRRGKTRDDYKIMLRSKHKIFESRFFWVGSGIPAVFSYTGKIIASNPLVMALMAIVKSPDNVKRELQMENKKTQKKTTIKLNFDPTKTKDFFKDAYDESQVQFLIAEERMDAIEEAQKSFGSKLVIPGIAIIVVIVVAWVLLGGGLG